MAMEYKLSSGDRKGYYVIPLGLTGFIAFAVLILYLATGILDVLFFLIFLVTVFAFFNYCLIYKLHFVSLKNGNFHIYWGFDKHKVIQADAFRKITAVRFAFKYELYYIHFKDNGKYLFSGNSSKMLSFLEKFRMDSNELFADRLTVFFHEKIANSPNCSSNPQQPQV